uniref:Early nodulin-like protein 2 n=1 Tax=Anthurium amnicola TaxID=1678845 RepID=A0A1D1YC34_9ARAE
MASLVQRRSPCWLLAFSFLACVALISTTASAVEFRVGGVRGWHNPTGDESETYNQWARRNRFHIGDTLYFKYENDSVLVVNYDDYSGCSLINPLLKLADHNTTFEFNRYGFFYFISGQPGHCKAGQKVVVRVMVHPASMSPHPAPAPAGGSYSGWGPGPSGSPRPSSSFQLRVDLCAVVGALVVLVATSLLV